MCGNSDTRRREKETFCPIKPHFILTDTQDS
uniref:Uncharacterized protein n=1 Tax=Anguilla anguilla TaxID=7936 RepID=A0A0E9RNX7_ANGAN